MSELYSSRLRDGGRTYFFDVKETQGERWLALTIAHNVNGIVTRQRLAIRERTVAAFVAEFLQAVGKMERESSSYIVQQKLRHPNAYSKWTEEDDRKLRDLLRVGAPIAEIARDLQRNEGAIRSRLAKLSEC